VGDVIHGFAYGAFGRDHYDCVRVEAVGPDWIVARAPGSFAIMASGHEELRLCQQARDEGCVECILKASGPPLTTWRGYTGG
jgi:hypothetical protein